MADAARTLGLPLWEVETVTGGEGFGRLASWSLEVLVVVAYGEILPRSVLEIPQRGAINVHFSLLPELRGAAPVQHALLRGKKETGVTTILMDEGLDTGPILLQERVEIAADDDAESLGRRLAEVGGRLLVATLDGLAAGSLTPRPQSASGATHAPKLTRADRRIDWSQPAGRVLARIRAFSPEPGAFGMWADRVVKVFRAEAVEGSGPPGTVLDVRGGISVACGSGAVRLVVVAPEGRKRMPAEDFARGARLRPGSRLS